MLGRIELEIPGPRTVRSGQLDLVTIEPDDEDLRLHGAVDVPTHRLPGHVTRQGLAAVRSPVDLAPNRCHPRLPPRRAPRPKVRSPVARRATRSATQARC